MLGERSELGETPALGDEGRAVGTLFFGSGAIAAKFPWHS